MLFVVGENAKRSGFPPIPVCKIEADDSKHFQLVSGKEKFLKAIISQKETNPFTKCNNVSIAPTKDNDGLHADHDSKSKEEKDFYQARASVRNNEYGTISSVDNYFFKPFTEDLFKYKFRKILESNKLCDWSKEGPHFKSYRQAVTLLHEAKTSQKEYIVASSILNEFKEANTHEPNDLLFLAFVVTLI